MCFGEKCLSSYKIANNTYQLSGRVCVEESKMYVSPAKDTRARIVEHVLSTIYFFRGSYTTVIWIKDTNRYIVLFGIRGSGTGEPVETCEENMRLILADQ